ncbi:hypothetical protein SVAN01_10830 [Stagonosporopsis vannaccii]|nr:hypothetical protein SVAN01_10830 [Stagonosporopsis vannaccii]
MHSASPFHSFTHCRPDNASSKRAPFTPSRNPSTNAIKMSQHKYNQRQMLFVKNVPQDFAVRIAALFAQYKPLETKNLFPDSRITTVMVALPSVGAMEEALRRTDGLKFGSTVISVERFNANQSVVARRDARKKGNAEVGQRRHFQDGNDEGYDDYDANELPEVKTGLEKSLEKMAVLAVNPLAAEARKIHKDGGVSWANVASGATLEQHTSSLAPAVQEQIDWSLRAAGSPLLRGQRCWNTRPFGNATGASTHHCPPTEGTLTSPVAGPVKPPPGFEHCTPKIIRTPATASPTSRPAVPLLPTSTPSGIGFNTARESLTPARATQTESSESRRAADEFSQQSQRLDVKQQQQQRGSLDMGTDTGRFVHERHCRDCVICQLRLNRRR